MVFRHMYNSTQPAVTSSSLLFTIHGHPPKPAYHFISAIAHTQAPASTKKLATVSDKEVIFQ